MALTDSPVPLPTSTVEPTGTMSWVFLKPVAALRKKPSRMTTKLRWATTVPKGPQRNRSAYRFSPLSSGSVIVRKRWDFKTSRTSSIAVSGPVGTRMLALSAALVEDRVPPPHPHGRDLLHARGAESQHSRADRPGYCDGRRTRGLEVPPLPDDHRPGRQRAKPVCRPVPLGSLRNRRSPPELRRHPAGLLPQRGDGLQEHPAHRPCRLDGRGRQRDRAVGQGHVVQ